MALTTFRTDGRAVTTPVWFVVDGAELLLWTGAGTGKLRRLRRTPCCTVAPCTTAGRITGPALEGVARELAGSEGRRVQRLLRRKYPVQKRALDAWGWVRRRGRLAPAAGSAYVAVMLH